jgi:predicted Holliday junction resolvase-like endonuclease
MLVALHSSSILTILHLQVHELKKKQEAQQQLLRQKQKSDEAAKRLQEDIQRIKSQKVFSRPNVSECDLSFFPDIYSFHSM